MHDELSTAATDLARFASDADRQALERCLAACLQPAYRHAYSLLGCDADAQDAVQEALLQLTRSAQRFDSQRALGPWLARHVADACARLRRGEGRRKRREERHAAMNASSADMLDGVDQEAIRLAVAELSERDQRVIGLHYFAELSQADCAEALGISENACAVRLHRARERLKKLLLGRGIAAGLLALPALAQAAPVAPASLLPQVVSTCTAATLPATTISLTLLQQGTWFMHTHPIISALLLMFSCSLPFVPLVVSAAEKEAATAAGQEHRWSPAAAALLPLVDEEAPLRMAGDIEGLRAVLLRCHPFNAYAEGPYLDNVRAQLHRWVAWNKSQDEPLIALLLEHTRGFVFNGWTRRDGRLKSCIAIDAGDDADALNAEVTQHATAAAIEGFALYRDGTSDYGRSGSQFLITRGYRDRLPALLGKDTGDQRQQQSSLLWLEIDAGSIIEAYAQALAEVDVFGLERYLGPAWQHLQPRLRLVSGEEEGQLTFHGRIDDMPTAGPWITALLASDYLLPVAIPAAPLVMRNPDMLPPADPEALVEIRLGSDYPVHHELIKELDQQLLPLGLSRLASSWNGQLLLRLRESPMFPVGELVLGCEGYDAEFGRQFVALLADFMPSEIETPEGYRQAWQCFTPAGVAIIAQAEDRLVLSLAGDMQQLLETSRDDCALSVDIDLPRLGQRWLPMVWTMLPERFFAGDFRDDRLMRVLRVLARGTDLSKSGADIDAWLGNSGEPGRFMQHVAVYGHGADGQIDMSKPLQYVYRAGDAYVCCDGRFAPQFSDAVDRQAVDTRLAGMIHVNGATVETLVPHPRGAVPVFRRDELLPAPVDLAKALPRYRLRWWQDGSGQRFEESGFPLAGSVCLVAGLSLMESDPVTEVRDNLRMHQAREVLARQQERLAGLKTIAGLLQQRGLDRQQLFAVLSAEQRTLLGVDTAADLQRLGIWYPLESRAQVQVEMIMRVTEDARQYNTLLNPTWALPLEGEWWVVMGFGQVGILEKARIPRLPQQQAQPAKQATEPLDF